MNERIVPGPELTGRGVSSRLNEAPFLNRGNFAMPESHSPEQPQGNAVRGQERTQDTNRVGRESLSSEIRRMVQERIANGEDQDVAEGRAVLRMFGERGMSENRGLNNRTGEFPVIAGGADVPENEGWEPGEERRGLGRIDSPEGLGLQFNNIVSLINRDISREVIKEGDEESLEVLRGYRKLLNEQLVGLPDSQMAYGVLDQLDQVEKTLVQHVVENGRGSARDKAQYRLMFASGQFEREYKDIEDALRNHVPLDQIDPGRLADYKREKQHLVTEIIEQIEDQDTPSIEAQRFPPYLLEAALKFRETREFLINEIIFKPYDDVTEQGHYEINFFASGNLDELLAVMSRLAKRSPEDKKLYQDYKGIKTTARNFWEMNRGLWTGTLENFSRIAEEMNYEQFDLMKDLPGVGTVMRLYDQKLYEELGKSGRITAEGFERVKKAVERSFRSLNAGGVLKSEYYDERDGDEETRKKFEEWEINRALSIGRVYHNITFRSSEVIALSQINKAGGGKAYTSFPFENAVRTLNPILTAERFTIGEKLGGMELWKKAVKANRELMKEDKRHLGINRFTHINGVKVDDMEFTASLGISGVFSGWRMFYAMYPTLKIEVQGENGEKEYKTLEQIFDMDDSGIVSSKGLGGRISAIEKNSHLKMNEKQDMILKEMEFLIGDKGQLNVGLGALLRLLQGNAATNPLGGEAGFKVREQIWRKIGQTNHLAIINVLTGLQEQQHDAHGRLIFNKDGEPEYVESKKSLRNLLEDKNWITNFEAKVNDPKAPDYYLNNPDWIAFVEKLQLEQEMNVKKQVDPTFKGELPEGFFTPKEIDMKNSLTKTFTDIDASGRAMTSDMADIVFPFMTFLNDVPFEHFNYQNVGNQFFKRRLGDIGQYNSAVSKGIIPLLDNIGGMKPDDVVGAWKELVGGIKGPNGEDSGWNAALPWQLAYISMAESNAGLDSWGPYKDIKTILKKETSELQHYAGTHAPSMNKDQVYNFLHHMRHAGVVSHHTEELIRKKKKVLLGDLIWAFIMDVVVMAAMDMAISTVKSPVSLKA